MASIRPSLDTLEHRVALSLDPVGGSLATSIQVAPSGGLSITGVDPAPDSTVPVGLLSLSVTFDRAIDPASLLGDFRLDRIADDGSVWVDSHVALNLTENLGSSPSRVELALDQPLDGGRYRLVLLSDAGLSAVDGSMVGVPADATISSFSVRAASNTSTSPASPGSPVSGGKTSSTPDSTPSAPGFESATDLGVLSPSVAAQVSSTLDLASDPDATRLFRVEVPSGTSWRLGAEVVALRAGSPLVAGLTVFDSAGRPIATDGSAATGVASDPYLFKALGSGVYYLGISAASNRPGQPGGYRLETPRVGTVSGDLSSGGFTLRVVADPITTPTRLTTFAATQADPTVAIPTGLTLQFDGPLDLRSLSAAPGSAITLVDAAGRSWSATLNRVDAADARVSFLFDHRLPAGTYSVRLADGSSLADLAGQAPETAGLPAGILGSLVVTGATPASAEDLGPIAPADAAAGVSGTATGSTLIRFFVTHAAPFRVDFDGVAATSVRAGFDSDPSGSSNTAYLQPGVHTLWILTDGATTQVGWTIHSTATLADSLLDAGIGHGSALDLRVVSPSVLATTPVPAGSSTSGLDSTLVSPSANGSTPTAATNSARGELGRTIVGETNIPAGPAAYFAVLATTPVGHPGTFESGPTAVAARSSSPSTPAAQALARRGDPGASNLARAFAHIGSDGDETAESSFAGITPDAIALDLPPLPGDATTPTLARGSLLDPILAMLGRLGGKASNATPDPIPTEGTGTVVDLAALPEEGDSEPAVAEEPQVASADLTRIVGAGLVAIAAAHGHRRVGRWVARRRERINVRRNTA